MSLVEYIPISEFSTVQHTHHWGGGGGGGGGTHRSYIVCTSST